MSTLQSDERMSLEDEVRWLRQRLQVLEGRYEADTRTSTSFETLAAGMRAYKDFHGKFSNLFSKLLRLESELRSIGSGGHAMVAQRDVRKSLERVMRLYGSYLALTHSDGLEIREKMSSLAEVEKCDPQKSRQEATDYGTHMTDYENAFGSLRKACEDFKERTDGFLDTYYNDCLKRILLEIIHFLTNFLKFSSNARANYPTVTTESYRVGIDSVFAYLSRTMPAFSEEIATFVKDGIPLIRVMQHQRTSRNLTMTTIATFFAGVTVAMMQYTYDKTTTQLAVAVNTLLFSSLIFSIASAAHSLLVVVWRQSFVQAPTPKGLKFPFGVFSDWILNGPTLYLTLAGFQFSLALCFFTASSQQDSKTQQTVFVLSSVHALALFILWAVFTYRRWSFRRLGGLIEKNITDASWTLRIFRGTGRLFERNPREQESSATGSGDGATRAVLDFESCVATAIYRSESSQRIDSRSQVAQPAAIDEAVNSSSVVQSVSENQAETVSRPARPQAVTIPSAGLRATDSSSPITESECTTHVEPGPMGYKEPGPPPPLSSNNAPRMREVNSSMSVRGHSTTSTGNATSSGSNVTLFTRTRSRLSTPSQLEAGIDGNE